MLPSITSTRPPIILASASLRRRELLAYIVDEFSSESADIDETPLQNESAYKLVERLAKKKAQFIAKNKPVNQTGKPSPIVIGSDTVVAQANEIFGKPKDFNDFTRMMQLLSDNCHQVYTGVCIVQGDEICSIVVVTKVFMGLINSRDISDYWATKEPYDKAGGYAIQGIGGKFVKSIEGSFSAVVGLPLYETKQLINEVQERRVVPTSRNEDLK